MLLPVPQAHASCFAATSDPSLSGLQQRVEVDPSAVAEEVRRRLADSSLAPARAAQLHALAASAYDVLDDNEHAREAVDAARRDLAGVPESPAKSTLAFRLNLIEADSLLSTDDPRVFLQRLSQLEATVPELSQDRACLLIVRSRLSVFLMRDEDSTSDALTAQRIAQTIRDPAVAADAAYQLAMSYRGYGMLEEGERLAAQAAAFHRSAHMSALLGNDLYISSDFHKEMKRYDAALADLEEARALNEHYHELIDVAFDDEHECAVLVDMHELVRARASCSRAEPVLRRAGRVDKLAAIEDHLAEADLLEHQPAAAVARITPLLDEPSQQIQRRLLRQLYQHRADALGALGRNAEALRDMREVVHLSELSASEEQERNTERVRARVHELVMQQENASLEAQVEQQRQAAAAEQSRLQIHRTLAAIAFLACCLLASAMWMRARRERARTQQRETLLKEIHHRVKNNLQIISSLLSLQARALDEPTVRVFSDSSQSRIRSMALVHEHLYQSAHFDRVSMQAYLGTLLDNIAAGQGLSQTIRCEVNAGRLMLGTDQASTCGLIVNEVATNAFKHAFPDGGPGIVSVSMRQRNDGLIELLIRDNGVGYAPGRVSAPQESFGTRLVEMLVSQLEGRVYVTHQDGTEFRLLFPGTA